MSKIWVVLLAAGSGNRFGAKKQFEKIDGKTLVQHSIEIAKKVADEVLLVLPVGETHSSEDVHVCFGGEERYGSTQNAIKYIHESGSSKEDIICIHDVARAFCPVSVYQEGIQEITKGEKAVIPVLSVTDTIKQKKADRIVRTLNRSELVSVQTPQFFSFDTLCEAYDKANFDNLAVTDDSQLCEVIGVQVKTIPGSKLSTKITFKEDMNNFKSTVVSGLGFDVHPYEQDPNSNKQCMLAGLEFEGPAFVGHSDGDIILHALCDAILSSLGLEDLGSLFNAKDEKYKDISSVELLEEVVVLAKNKNLQISSIALVLWSEVTRVGKRRNEIIENIKRLLSEITSGNTIISVSAKNGEGLGFVGASEGATCGASISAIA